MNGVILSVEGRHIRMRCGRLLRLGNRASRREPGSLTSSLEPSNVPTLCIPESGDFILKVLILTSQLSRGLQVTHPMEYKTACSTSFSSQKSKNLAISLQDHDPRDSDHIVLRSRLNPETQVKGVGECVDFRLALVVYVMVQQDSSLRVYVCQFEWI